MKGLLYCNHQPLEDSLFQNSLICPSHTPLSTVESDWHFQFAFVLVTDALNHQNDHPPSTTLFAPLSGYPCSLHILGFYVQLQLSATTLVFSAYPESNCEYMSAFIETHHR